LRSRLAKICSRNDMGSLNQKIAVTTPRQA
jgi:hypothetical protein